VTDLLTHVLVAGITLSLLGRWRGWPARRYVPLGMGGATLPDITKINYVVPRQQVADLLGVPFSWLPFHRLGGAVAVAVGLALLFERDTRRTVLAVLLGGVTSHFLLDALIERAHGITLPYLYPLSWYRPPGTSA
jgi:hypothetical protein